MNDGPFVEDLAPSILNLTPHDIIVRMPDGDRVIPESGQVARIKSQQVECLPVDGIPVVRTLPGIIEGLPAPAVQCHRCGAIAAAHATDCVCGQPDFVPIWLIVSSMVAQACQERADVLAPDTGPTAIREKNGQIVAVTRLQSFTE